MKYQELNSFVQTKQNDILDWIEQEYGDFPKPIFTSVDIRNAGFKIAHVDANLFPGGFNNTSLDSREDAAKLLHDNISKNYPNAKNILLIPENFTRNQKYRENVTTLSNLIEKSGYNIKIGAINDNTEVSEFENEFQSNSVARENDVITAGEFKPDLIILNNDLTQGVPSILESINQPVAPHTSFGWFKRRKTAHFNAYSKIVEKFSKEFSLDPWLISTFTDNCNEVDFRNKTGIECIAAKVDRLIRSIREKYLEYGIKSMPYVFLKSDMGTYGMGIMHVKNADEVLNINKKNRHSMSKIKGGVHNSEVLLQEGVPTIEISNNHYSETMAYMINGRVFDLIQRVNDSKDENSNLNSKGMYFQNNSREEFNIKICIAMLAALATTKEIPKV